jgi:hypothetical protein
LLATSCSSGGSGQDYTSVQRSAQTVRSKLKGYSAQTIEPPPEVCQRGPSAASGKRWEGVGKPAVKAAQPGAGVEATDVADGDEPSEAVGGPVAVTRTGDGWEIRSEGGTMAAIVRQVDPQVAARLVARGRGSHAPIYARVRGEDWAELLERLAGSVGMEVATADGVTLVADARLAAHLQREAARRSVGDAPLATTYMQVEHPERTARFLAEFALGCRGSILVLPEKNVLYVEDTDENLESMREWAESLNQQEGELDRTFSRDRVERHGVPEATLPICSQVPLGPEEVGPHVVPVGALVLAQADKADNDVVVGCGSSALVASTADGVPGTAKVATFLGLSPFAEQVWTSESFAAKAKRLRAQAEVSDTWRVVRHEPMPSGLQLLLEHRFSGHFRTLSTGWGDKILLSVRTGYMDKIKAVIAEYHAVEGE